MTVTIGVDPHKGSHTAVAINDGEAELATTRVRATRRQVDQLLSWAAPFDKRVWAIESAGRRGAVGIVGAAEHDHDKRGDD